MYRQGWVLGSGWQFDSTSGQCLLHVSRPLFQNVNQIIYIVHIVHTFISSHQSQASNKVQRWNLSCSVLRLCTVTPGPVNLCKQSGTSGLGRVRLKSQKELFKIWFGRDCKQTGIVWDLTLWKRDLRPESRNISVSHFYPEKNDRHLNWLSNYLRLLW